MGDSFRLARISGIEIGVNWSWLVVVALLTWSLSQAVFPDQNPGLSNGTYVAMGIVASLAFFGCLLLHELGHAFQARREGMQIEGITLWLFGGVARFRGTFPTAGAEFRIAIAGPLVSLALGVAFALAAWGLDLPDAVDGVAAWLGYINLVLLVFNLLPALPLDGGRVLRSALWGARRDFVWATQVSVAISRGFGYLMIAGGIALLVFQSAFSGVWLAFIGWFLLAAAGAETRMLAAQQALAGLAVRDLMVADPVTVSPDLTLGELMDRIVWTRRHTTYPVVEDGVAVGLLPFRCVAAVPRSEWDGRRVRDCMLARDAVPVVAPDEPVFDALQQLGDGSVGRALVLGAGGRLAGLLSISDVARVLELRRARPTRAPA